MDSLYTPARSFRDGFRYGAPVMLGYAPVSFAFAVAAVAGGLPWPIVLLISLSNFTSAGQVAGAGLMNICAPLPEIAITVFVINIRYSLMSLSLSQKLRHLTLYKRLLLANGVTDEIFFLASQKEGNLSGWFFAGLASGPYLGWAFGTLLGGLAGEILPAYISSALGIALYAMFIAIVIPPAKKSRAVALVTICAVSLACLFRYVPGLKLVPSGWALILCAVTASVLGAILFPINEDVQGGQKV